MASKRTAHYVISTHWDREWRQSFQELRYDLIKLMDHVIGGIEDGRMRGSFFTDGQSIIIDDYLQIRPERKAQVERLIQEKKLEVGPWYTMPDEFLPSGEALVRNLLLGRDIVRSFGGKPSDAGYIPDMFGHTSQLPQIFAGFGIHNAFLWRGVHDPRRRNFIWRGADGTEIFCLRFGHVGYGDFMMKLRRVFNFAIKGCDVEKFSDRLEEYLGDEAECSEVDPILVHDALDHLHWDEEAYSFLTKRMDVEGQEIELIHSSFEKYLDEALPQKSKVTKVLEGELREPGRGIVSAGAGGYGLLSDGNADLLEVDQQWVIPGVASSRVRLKQANAWCETLLCQWAEPFSAFATLLLGDEYPLGFLDLSWRYVLENHPHDSLGGCSIDQVHLDMEHRFEQSRLIADRLTREAVNRIAANVEGKVEANELRVVVFNPMAQAHSGSTQLQLHIPSHWVGFMESFGYEFKPGFRIFGPNGEEIPYQRLGQKPGLVRDRYRLHKVVEAVSSTEVSVALPLDIPALGYTTLTVRVGKVSEPTRHFGAATLATGEASMANEYISVQIESNGSLTITDKETGSVYSRLLTFEDSADIGDGWNHGVAINDQFITTSAAAADVALIYNGPMQTTFQIRTKMTLPEEFTFGASIRSERRLEMPIDTMVTLRPGKRYVEIKSDIDNVIKDHRVRVLFPTGAKADTYLVESAFDVVERDIALRADNDEYREVEIETKPQQNWVAVHDQSRGLAITSFALRESAVRDLPERPIALTLFRGTRKTAFTAGEPGGQSLGKLSFRYCIHILDGAPDRTALSNQAQQLAAGLKTAQQRTEDQEIYITDGNLPQTSSMLSVEGDAVVTSTRMAAEGIEVRVFNPTTSEAEAKVRLDAISGKVGSAASRVDFESHELSTLSLTDGGVTVAITAKQIATVRFTG